VYGVKRASKSALFLTRDREAPTFIEVTSKMPTAFLSSSDSIFSRPYTEEIKIVFSAIDCILNGDQAIYGSSQLTSGVRLYEALRQYKLKTEDELKEQMSPAWFQANIFDENAEVANKFARFVRSRVSDNTMVITPAPFYARGWKQPEYLFFWETLIRTRIKSVWFNREWQFSNGCTFEFAVALDAELPTFDHDGKPLDRTAGIAAIESAIERLEAEGFDTTKLLENLEKLRAPRLVPTAESPLRP
jgi:hypothetical protein